MKREAVAGIAKLMEKKDGVSPKGATVIGEARTASRKKTRREDQASVAARGKRGGHRLIYLVDQTDKKIIPLLLYSKTQKQDVTAKELKALLARLNRELNEKADGMKCVPSSIPRRAFA